MDRKEYQFGDMIIRYDMDEELHVGMLLYPAERKPDREVKKHALLDPMLQVKLTGDIYQGCYAPGNTLRNGESTQKLTLKSQKLIQEEKSQMIETILQDERGYQAVHRVIWEEGERFIRIRCSYANHSKKAIDVEMLSSFSLTGISPYLEGDCSGAVQVHRLQSRWSQEGRHLVQSIEELQLESCWNLDSVRCERFGQVGSMPVNHYFPFLAIEDTENQIFWGVQLAQPASWQMEIYRKDENIAISGGMADREFGHWMKHLNPGEKIEAPEAIVSVAATDSFDWFTQRLVEAGEKAVSQGPREEQELPIIFNEYCTTWGCPSHENITGILDVIKDKGFSYFVIDCGWYKEDGVPWDISMGDYVPSKTLFPQGLEKTVNSIHQAGMKAGIWFEIENVGPASQAYQKTEHLLKRDGKPLTTTRRRFWDMNDPWVQAYLKEKVIGTLKRYGFEYMKIDYNDTIGPGCDGAESVGEGLRKNMQATMDFLELVKKEIPGIILENCASGGHRLEPGFMAAASMASFSDAHECVEIPIIAANLHYVILPRQSQIWAVIRESDSLKRIAYSVTSTFLGRMCISGDVTNLSDAQWNVIERGMAFYRNIASIIKKGQTYHCSPQISQIRHPKGWQGIVRCGSNGEIFVLIHIFGGNKGEEIPEKIQITRPEFENSEIAEIYSDTEEDVMLDGDSITYIPYENWKGVAIRLKKRT